VAVKEQPQAGQRVLSIKATAEARAAVEESGQTPLQYMVSVMRDPKADARRRDAMAAAAAPYVHHRLSSTE